MLMATSLLGFLHYHVHIYIGPSTLAVGWPFLCLLLPPQIYIYIYRPFIYLFVIREMNSRSSWVLSYLG